VCCHAALPQTAPACMNTPVHKQRSGRVVHADQGYVPNLLHAPPGCLAPYTHRYKWRCTQVRCWRTAPACASCCCWC
jgi:hypothetical protein